MVTIPRLTTIIVTLFALLFMVTLSLSGQKSDTTDMKTIAFLYEKMSRADDSVYFKKEAFLPQTEVSDLSLFAHFMIRLYQTFVSSQHYNVCVFTPSCSHFGMESVRRYGFVQGVFLTADRLTRCNGFVAKGGYLIDSANGKFIDRIETYGSDTSNTPFFLSPSRVQPQ